MNIFLNMLSEEFSNYRMIPGMDNASRHGNNNCIENIVPLFQLPHSPELNPAEHVWKEVRENGGFKNQTFDTLRDVEQKLCEAVLRLRDDKEKIKSLTGFGWVLSAISDIMIAV